MDDAEKRARQLASQLGLDGEELDLTVPDPDPEDTIRVIADAIREAVAAERERIVSIVKACDPDTVYVSAGDGEEYAGGVDMEQARGWILDRIEGKAGE
jgi:hypothetical protein